MWPTDTGAVSTTAPPMFDLDTTLFLWINANAASPGWVVTLARLASTEFVQWLMAGTAGAFLVGDARLRRIVLRVLLAMATAWLVARFIQHMWPMPRPFAVGLGTVWLSHGDSAGFPSTHSSVMFAFAATVAFYARNRSAAVAAVAAALLVAWSRVCLGLHFPFDVLTGMLVGVFSAWLCAMAPSLVPGARTAHE